MLKAPRSAGCCGAVTTMTITAAVAFVLLGLHGIVPVESGDGRKQSHTIPHAIPIPQTTTTQEPTCVRSPLTIKNVDLSNYELGCEEIQGLLQGNKTLLGNGHIRDVYLADYKGKGVVIKTLREETEKKRQDITLKMHHIKTAALDAVRGHPNIVGLLGVCNTAIVTENFSTQFDDVILRPRERLPASTVIPMALDAARGLQGLHEVPGGPIVHFDLKPQQLMFDEHSRVKINDLNMARLMERDSVTGDPCPFECRHAVRAIPWRAPENIAGKQLVQDMWRSDPNERPSAAQVVARLEAILQASPNTQLDEGDGSLLPYR